MKSSGLKLWGNGEKIEVNCWFRLKIRGKGKNIGVNSAIVGLKMIMDKGSNIGVNCKISGVGIKGTKIGFNIFRA